MALPPILPVIAEFKKVGPLLAALEATFDSLRNDEIVKAIFLAGTLWFQTWDWDQKNDDDPSSVPIPRSRRSGELNHYTFAKSLRRAR